MTTQDITQRIQQLQTQSQRLGAEREAVLRAMTGGASPSKLAELAHTLVQIDKTLSENETLVSKLAEQLALEQTLAVRAKLAEDIDKLVKASNIESMLSEPLTILVFARETNEDKTVTPRVTINPKRTLRSARRSDNNTPSSHRGKFEVHVDGKPVDKREFVETYLPEEHRQDSYFVGNKWITAPKLLRWAVEGAVAQGVNAELVEVS